MRLRKDNKMFVFEKREESERGREREEAIVDVMIPLGMCVEGWSENTRWAV